MKGSQCQAGELTADSEREADAFPVTGAELRYTDRHRSDPFVAPASFGDMELEIVQLPIQLSSFLVAPNSGPFLARFGSLCGDDPAISCVIAVEFQDLLGPAGPV